MTTVFATTLAEALASLRHFDEALQTIEQAIAQIGADGESFDMPEMLRVKGKVLALIGRTADAEGVLRRSLETARTQSALGWELRAAITLGRLYQMNGRPAEAKALVAPLQARFTEGLGSLDLIAARTLLQDLNLAAGQ